MKCSTCGIEHESLVCPACAERRSREAYLSLQQVYLPNILSGKTWLVLNRRARSGPFHVALFGDPLHAYCGERLDGPQQRRKAEYSAALRPGLCAGCVETFDDLVGKEAALARAAEAEV